jgi:hypothetical protein
MKFAMKLLDRNTMALGSPDVVMLTVRANRLLRTFRQVRKVFDAKAQQVTREKKHFCVPCELRRTLLPSSPLAVPGGRAKRPAP